MTLADMLYGPLPGSHVGPAVAATNPAHAPTATRAESQPARPVSGEPGGNAPAHKAVADNPVTWLIVTLAVAVAAARYAGIGRLL